MFMALIRILSTDADAATKKVCVSLATQYESLVPGQDYWNSNGNRRFRGIEINVWDELTSTLHTEFASYSGPDRGCASFDLEPTAGKDFRYAVYTRSLAKVSATTPSQVRDVRGTVAYLQYYNPAINLPGCIPGSGPCFKVDVLTTNLQVPGLPTTELILPWENVHGEVMVGTWIFRRSDWGISPSVAIEYKDLSDPTAVPPVINVPPSAQSVFNGSTPSKATIAHETGHIIMYYLMGQVPFNLNYDAMNWCSGFAGPSQGSHQKFSVEYEYAAFIEGWADFVDAWTWNNPSQSDCVLSHRPQEIDYDVDGHVDSTATTPAAYSCETAPWDLDHDGIYDVPYEGTPDWNPAFPGSIPPSYLTARHWLGDMVGAGRCGSTTLLNQSYSVDYDWARFFWDLATDEGMGPSDFATWLGSTSLPSMNRTAAWDWFPATPFKRLEASASASGFGTEFGNQAGNVR